MKTPVIFRLGLVLLSFALVPLAHAQAPAPGAPDPALGYWNLETNLTTRDHSLVRFYNADHQLVYEERLEGLCLDLGRRSRQSRRTSKQLNVALQQVLLNPAAAQKSTMLAEQLSPNRRRSPRTYAAR